MNELISADALRLKEACDGICRVIAEYFKTLFNHDGISCAIRLAKDHPVNGIEYATVGRYGFSPGREELSEVIIYNQGIPNAFYQEYRNRGVQNALLIFFDMEQSIRERVYVETRSDRAYPNDYSSMMVMPIWGLDVLYATLHVTAKKDVFRPRHFNITQVFSILLKKLLPAIVEKA